MLASICNKQMQNINTLMFFNEIELYISEQIKIEQSFKL